jgi:hypothetical protein
MRCAKDEVIQWTLVQRIAVEIADPRSNHWAARRMRDARKTLALCQFRYDLGCNGRFHSASNIINHDFVCETHIFAEIEVIDCKVQIGRGIFTESFGQSTVCVGISHAPTMNEHESHRYLLSIVYKRRIVFRERELDRELQIRKQTGPCEKSVGRTFVQVSRSFPICT